MINPQRIVSGTVLKLHCQKCGKLFPHFLFSGEDDMETEGLCSASSCSNEEVVLIEAEPPEWSDFDRLGATAIEQRLAKQLSRNDLRIPRLLRVERDETRATGLSFSDFRKSFKRPVLVFSCACCSDGECRSIEELTLNDFQKNGGRVLVTGRLAL